MNASEAMAVAAKARNGNTETLLQRCWAEIRRAAEVGATCVSVEVTVEADVISVVRQLEAEGYDAAHMAPRSRGGAKGTEWIITIRWTRPR